MADLSQPTQRLISRYQVWHQSLQAKEKVSVIHVDEVASRVASFYEKIRGIVDWREEHLLRKAAIERILKRRLFFLKNGQAVAEPLVLELIRGGHFPNDKIEEAKIPEVQELIDKYVFILGNSPTQAERQKARLYDWILGIAACELEEILAPPLREKALMEYMTEIMKERIEVREGIIVRKGISSEEKDSQIYIAVQRALLKLDKPLISYNLLKKRYPQWPKLTPADFQLSEIAQNIYSIWKNLEKDLKHPLAEKFYKISERYDTAYLILGDIISQDPIKAKVNLENPETLENSIREAYNRRIHQTKSRVKRAAIYSTLSIFLTKMLLAFAIEVPFDKYITGEFSYFTSGINIILPPLLMFFLVLTVRPPKKENLEQVIMEIMKISQERERKDIYEIKPSRKRGIILNTIITLFYLLTFFISFGIIIWGLNKLNFGILSQVIFLMFVSLISFAGTRIRERAKELEVTEEKGNFLTFILDSFSLPFLRMGRWLSSQWTRYNVLVVLFNSLIDMPFQVFVEFLEHWRSFLKEKKEEIH